MLDKLTTWKAFAAIALIASPASLGIAALGGLIGAPADTTAPAAPAGAPAPVEALAPAEPGTFGGVVYKEFSKTYDAAPATGALDLRIDWGEVRVIAWDEPAYLVRVLQEPHDPAQVSDYETIVDFQDVGTSDRIDIRLTVDQEGTYGVGAHANVQGNEATTGDPSPDTAIVAYVPRDTRFATVLACSGQQGPYSDAFADVPWPLDEEERVAIEEECMPRDDSPGLSMNVGAVNVDTTGSSNKTGLNVTHGAEGIRGDALTIFADHGDVHASDVDFAEATLLARFGDVVAANARVGELTMLSEHGDLLASGDAASAKAWTNFGSVAMDLAPATSGALDIFSEHGDVALKVANGPGVGYAVEAGTGHGDLLVRLNATPVETRDAADEEDADWTDPNTWVEEAQSWLSDEEGYRYTATGRTTGYDGLPVQVEVRAFSQFGDVIVTDLPLDLVKLAGDGDDRDHGHA